jgi:hypothetical protein
MSRRVIATALTLGVLLSGCSSPTPESGSAPPSPEPSSNEKACGDFAFATDRFSTLVIAVFSDQGLTDDEELELDAMGGTFDSIALSAEGEVAERMSIAAQFVLDDGITLGVAPDDYFDSVESVARACNAEGFESAFATWS